MNTLEGALKQIQAVYDVRALAQQRMDTATIIQYYNQTFYTYGYLHSRQGSIHLALNPDGTYDPDGFYAQPRTVEMHLCHQREEGLSPSHVLEMGCGKGFNTFYLAQREPTLRFTALDRTPRNIAEAYQTAQDKQLDNTRFLLGDYHDLPFPDQHFDCVFIFEAICYARDMACVLAEAYRVLRPGGMLIIYDFFRARALESLSDPAKLAARLTEKSFVVDDAHTWNAIQSLVAHTGFEILEANDLSHAILPNVERFASTARLFFQYPFVARLLRYVLPPYMLLSLIAGLLLPVVLHEGIEGYYGIVARRALLN